MRRIRYTALLTLAAVALISAGLATSTALASGPLWLHKGTRFDCETKPVAPGLFKSLLECLGGRLGPGHREWARLFLVLDEGRLLLDQGVRALELTLTIRRFRSGNVITIECKHVHVEVVLVGGNPGKDHAVVHETECEVEGHPKCTVKSTPYVEDDGEGEEVVHEASVGLILLRLRSELVYIGTKKQAEEEKGPMGDLFLPEQGETFADLEIGGEGCPLFTKGEQEIKGDEIAEVEPVNSLAKEGKVILPSTAIKTAWRWTGAGKVEEIKAGLKAFGVLECIESGEDALLPEPEGESTPPELGVSTN